MCAINFSFIKVVMLPLNGLFLLCWSTLRALATESKDLFCDCEMSLILFWAVVEEEDDDKNSIFPTLMKMEEEESLFSGLMKMESDEKE